MSGQQEGLAVAADPVELEPPRTLRNAGSPGSEEGVFTHYLRSLRPDGEPQPKAFDALWQALRAAVVGELRRRAAWTSPPSYFGVYGWQSWRTHDRRPGHTGSALEELVTDCYAFVFLERLPRLRAQLVMKPNVDGLVILYLRNYLHDRRKRHDLLGFHVFVSLRLAVRQAVEAGELWIVGGDPKVSNSTILAASPEADHTVGMDGEAIARIVEGWGHALLPELVTAAGSRRRQVVLRLRRLLLDLEAEGAPVVRFKDLVDRLKHCVRASWAASFDLEEGEAAVEGDTPDFAGVARLVQPEAGVEERESFDKLVACVAERVERLGESERARHYLRTFWGFLRAWASGEGPQRLPSSRGLSDLLHIPRKRFPRLWTTLKELVQCCTASLAGRPSEGPGGTEDTP
ncbi:MAG: hypothetical protein GY719_42700 [bacterium]|nr:hypothetical protein [bacterium]